MYRRNLTHIPAFRASGHGGSRYPEGPAETLS